MQKANITASTPQPEHGEIVKDAHGEPTGVFLERANDLIARALPEKTREDIQQAVINAGKDFAALGITTVHDMAVQQAHEWREMASLASRPDYPVRVWACIDQDKIEHLAALGLATGQGGENFQIGGAKFFADGALGSMTALMLEPFAGTDVYGFPVHSRELMLERFPLAIQAGLVPVIHAIGDAANQIVLDCLEASQHLWQAQHMRPRIEHAQHLKALDIPRFAQMGVIPSMQPIHYRFDAKRTTELLPDRLEGTHAWRKLIQAGSIIPLGSDTPVATPDVILGLETACKRKAESIEFGHDQVLTIDEALAGYTRHGAYAIGWEHRSGQLKAGFDADLVILSNDPHEGLEGLNVQATMKAGQWTFEK
jgi:predicted amidohydrolase YtcJ